MSKFHSIQRLSTLQLLKPLPPNLIVHSKGYRNFHNTLKRLDQEGLIPKKPWTSRLKEKWKATPMVWTPLPIGIGIALLILLDFLKKRRRLNDDGTVNLSEEPYVNYGAKVKGGWQVYVIGALPLRTISRLYGAFNSVTLPVWFRVPGFKFYAWVFGVNLAECETEDLKEFKNLSDFFMRRLKPGLRPAADSLLISPADGKVVSFGIIENRRINQVKGVTYSMDALLGGSGPIITNPSTSPSQTPTPTSTPTSELDPVDEEEFANLNGLDYTLDQLIGNEDHTHGILNPTVSPSHPPTPREPKDVSVTREESDNEDGPSQSALDHASVALKVGPSNLPWTVKGVPKPGNKMFYCVIYLAPGDYHRFHSPSAWVVERRRHFAGELFSVSPFMAKRLKDLFVLNERVALLGRWRHGFFSMTAVGATNVGSIRINFDKDLRTNYGKRPSHTGTFSEATYSNASKILNGQPLRPVDEMGVFELGSTIVLVFEAPEKFKFKVSLGSKVRVGESIGDI